MGLKAHVFFDTWAWRETANGTRIGQRLLQTYGPEGPAVIHTSVLALAETGSVVARNPSFGPEAARDEVRRMEPRSQVHAIEVEDVYAAVQIHPALRVHANASLADALVLAQARRLRLPFITGDSAFRGAEGVPQQWIAKP